MFLCNAPFISWTDNCTRSYFESLPSCVLVIVILCLSIPFIHTINWPIKSFITLPEAESIIDPSLPQPNGEHLERTLKAKSPLWWTICFSGFALGETIGWLVIASYRTVALHGSLDDRTIAPFLNAFVWLTAVIIPVLRPKPTPPYDLFALYVFQFVAGIFRFGCIWYDRDTLGISPLEWDVAASSMNLAVILTLLMIVMNMPLSIPTNESIAEKIGSEISPEDYTPLWGWITFEWIYPLIKRGTNDTLNEPDVWNLSPTMQSKPVYTKFSKIDRKGLFKRIWAANSLDLILDFSLTFVSVVFNYAGPFFLKRILDSLDPSKNSPEARSRAYIYAFLAFLSTICKAEADVLHLWFGRRAAVRIRSGLMASIYAKALVRKDYSGIVDKKEKEDKEDKEGSKHRNTTPSAARASESQSLLNVNGKSKKSKRPKKKDDKKDDAPTSGADVGKIVNLMSGDANRISMMISGAYFIYGAPFEIIIASVFLYQLLGLSAFAGFICLGVLSPLNSFLARRSIRIQKGVLAARDKRMGIVNELLNGVKLVKFYGWELRWIDRVLDARKYELKWLVKSRFNQVMFSMLWTNAPIMVSVVSFLTYVMTGHELSIPVAFTAIALFNMLRAPLNVIPTWIVQILQTKVALDRIATFLNEDEVSEEVSSIKQGAVDPSAESDQRLGISHSSFKWNEVEDDNKTPAPSTVSSAASTNTLPKSSSSSISTAESETDNDPGPSDSVSVNSQGAAEERRFELRDINVIFPKGKLTVVTGPTASGKTALLMALLGEMSILPSLHNGKIHLPKHHTTPDNYGYAGLSYAAQSPFLQHQTIRENILFGTHYDAERYEAVLEACALKPDLNIFEDGDMTEVGSRGISLSGGQKARVALARAVYKRSKCVLLDDPLSAVDSHTALFLYERLLKGPLLANRTVVLVTHNVELVLPGAYYLVRLLDGRIDVQGTTKELRERGILDAITKDSSAENQLEAREAPPDPTDAPDGTKKPRQLVKDEARETGSVKWRIYNTYMKATSYWTWIALSLGICMYQLLGVTEKLWIKQWGEAYTNTNDTNSASHLFYSTSLADGEGDIFMQHAYTSAHLSSAFSASSNSIFGFQLPSANENPLFYIGIYAAISFGAAFVSISNVVVQFTGGLRASKVLFKQLLVAVVRATMRWHDSTPTGRMLNRFSKDIETVDTSLGSSLQAVNSSMATFFASVLTVVFFSPLFLFPAIVIGFVYYKLGIGYLNTGRDLRRMESNSRSPIFSNFSELLMGIVTVRAFSSERRFLDNLHGKIDATTKMWYSFWMTNRWLLLHFDFLGGLAVLFTTLLALSGAIGAGFAGVTITSAMGFTTAVYWTCRFWTQLELDLNSVERVVEYLELPQEPPFLIEAKRPPAYWPSNSDNDSLIVVEDLVVKYSPELPSVLHGISFSLKARERVGLLGRTGSGKSTLAMSLLRFTEPSSGRILIDGVDITTIGLHDLRSRLTFVAQDAVLFSGTIRENIDPFGDYSDEDCLDALSRVHLLSESREASRISSRIGSRAPSIHEVDQEETIAASSTAGSPTAMADEKQGIITLDSQVSAGGSNFSQGQRQLLTMARALLRQSSIIILDEATSSIDYATDSKIQKAIREEFKNSLLLTVAHRLRTVIDYDRLIILDNGRVVEFDTPYNLIHREGSVFRDMCKHSGNFKELEESANKAAAERNVY